MRWQDQAARLAADLIAAGELDSEWRSAFESVPRHLFVPHALNRDGSPRTDTAEAAYRDESLITQAVRLPDTGHVVPTSSSTRPSLMARMLGMLDAAPGHTVLEIGTGTGYNAALLSHRLGDDAVTSIDIDPALVDAARATLASIGMTPTLITGDGTHGAIGRAPFDRILATCAVPAVPAAWVQQLGVDGRLVADVRAATSSTLITAQKDSTGTLHGRFSAAPGHFMWLRPNVADPFRAVGEGNMIFDRYDLQRATDLSPELVNDPNFGFQLAIRVPGIIQSLGVPDRGTHILRSDDGSWVEIGGNGSTYQKGTRSLADEIATVHDDWIAHNRPERSRYGLSVTVDGETTIWLDSPVDSI